MLSQMKLFTMSFLLLLLAGGCSSSYKTKTETPPSSDTTVAVAKEAEAKNFVEIKFKEGSALLTDEAKSSLRSVLKDAKTSGEIDEVIVLSWADQNYPSKDLGKLSKKQRDLANKRNKNVKNFVRSMRKVDVNSFNMAERPSTFSKLFDTADAKMKNSFVEAGISTTADSTDYSTKASHSVILIKTKN